MNSTGEPMDKYIDDDQFLNDVEQTLKIIMVILDDI
ncbi:MAG: hypothetical protein ACI9MS_000954 [Glaciecola sp.]|jgi:hypothetical protein